MEDFASGIRKAYLQSFSTKMDSINGMPMYLPDFVAFGLMDRNIALVEAIQELIAHKNIHAVAPLIRVQLDGLLRLHAFNLVENPDDLAMHIMQGKKLRRFKDKNGNKLTDRHLVNSLKLQLPWVEELYETLSGWVHFSESHIFAAASEGKSEDSIEIGIGSHRKEIPPKLFEEAIAAIEEVAG